MSIPALPPSGPLPLARALFQRPASSTIAGIQASYRLDRIDAAHVRRYRAAFGFAGAAVPLTYLYLLAQRAQLATMLDRPIPFRIPGLIHVENRLAMPAPVECGAALTLSTRLTLSPPQANGALECVLATHAHDGERLAFTCDSIYLVRRGQRGARAAAPEPPQMQGSELGGWTVAPDAGRRYAALSGDWNPIHLWRWSARLMGLRAPIIHGMHTAAMACALHERGGAAPARALDCRFLAPVPLGAAVSLRRAAPGRLTAICNGRPALALRVLPAHDTP